MGRQPVDIIPRDILFGNPDRAQVRLSRDGRWIAFLAPVKKVLNVWVAPSDDPAAAQPVTDDRKRGIRFYMWAHTNEHLLYIQDRDGDENWRVYATHVAERRTRDLTPYKDVSARILHVSPDAPGEILVGLNNRDARYHDVHRVNLRTGTLELVQENPGFAGFITDDDYNVRFATSMTPEGGVATLKPTADGGWEPFIVVSMEDALTTGHLGFDKTGRVAYWRDSRGRDTAALVALDLESGQQEVVAVDPEVDAGSVMVHPTEKHLQAVSFTRERRRWEVLDPEIEQDFDFLRRVSEGDLSVASRTLDDRQWIVVYTMDTGPARYYHYDRDATKARFLFVSRDDLEGLPLAPMRSAVVKSRDGLDLVCYYTLPVWADEEGTGIPGKPLPTVLMVHGGPWGRDTWGLNSSHQWLANRGYAALSVNFRGSTGFGKAFVNAGNMQWAAEMHDDLLDAVQWAEERGIAHGGRVAMMGGSYGGYATLVGLTFTPERFACGVDIVGPSNLVTLLSTIPPYWAPMVELFAKRVGDLRTEEGKKLLEERSPLHRADRIRRPLLIGQGANDPRVKQAESDQIVSAMQEKGIPVTYVLYPDEGHGFGRPENRMSFNAVAEAFLARHLGGRFQPVGGDFEGASITVPTGAEYVPGLTEALPKKQ